LQHQSKNDALIDGKAVHLWISKTSFFYHLIGHTHIPCNILMQAYKESNLCSLIALTAIISLRGVFSSVVSGYRIVTAVVHYIFFLLLPAFNQETPLEHCMRRYLFFLQQKASYIQKGYMKLFLFLQLAISKRKADNYAVSKLKNLLLSSIAAGSNFLLSPL